MAKGLIWNPSPDRFHGESGQFGAFTVPGLNDIADPKERGKYTFNRLLIEDHLCSMDQGDDRHVTVTVTGYEIAKDIVGRNPGWGLIATEDGQEPTAPQVREAQNIFEIADNERIKEADGIWQRTHDRSRINENAIRAARRRNKTREWVDADTEVAFVKCPACRSVVESGVLRCKTCGYQYVKPLVQGKEIESLQAQDLATAAVGRR